MHLKLNRVWLAFVVGLVAGCTVEEDESLTDISSTQQADESHYNACVPHTDGYNNDLANLQKYSNYRERFRSRFIRVNDTNNQALPFQNLPGMHIPASALNGDTAFFTDTTVIHAQYLGVLATEYALFHNRDAQIGPCAQTIKELVYALKALDRLDRTAESYFRENRSVIPPDLNGFFIRDDV